MREVGEMYLDELEDLLKYTDDHPPVHILVAAYLGVKADKPKQATGEEIASFFGLGSE